MDSSTSKASPFPPASETPLHRNPPLAPSQEMAYRNKCVQLKRRLNEIETNNDATRRRISTERERVAKMRLLRAILLNQLREVMETPGKKLSPEQLRNLGISEENKQSAKPKAIDTLLDDSSDESEDEGLPEPSERPTRTRRTNNNYREPLMNPNTNTMPPYQSTGLPNLAPANAFSPAGGRDVGPMTSSFHVGSTPLAADSPPQSYQQYGNESRYSQQSSPIQHHQGMYQDSTANGVPRSPIQHPIRPKIPIEQFREHMRPQLVADSYPSDQIEERIDAEWHKLSYENRGLWETRYEEQMMDYQHMVDQYNKARRREQAEAAGSRGGFASMNSR